jgi:hypothetical protein
MLVLLAALSLFQLKTMVSSLQTIAKTATKDLNPLLKYAKPTLTVLSKGA